MKIKMIVQKFGNLSHGMNFGETTDSKKYIQIRYNEFENRDCEYVNNLREKYEIICRRLKLKESDE